MRKLQQGVLRWRNHVRGCEHNMLPLGGTGSVPWAIRDEFVSPGECRDYMRHILKPFHPQYLWSSFSMVEITNYYRQGSILSLKLDTGTALAIVMQPLTPFTSSQVLLSPRSSGRCAHYHEGLRSPLLMPSTAIKAQASSSLRLPDRNRSHSSNHTRSQL